MSKLLLIGEMDEFMPQITKRLPGWDIIQNPEPRDYPIHIADAEVLFGYLHWIPGMNALKTASKLKWIQSLSAGVDSMPFDLLKEKGILLTNASGVHANSISESVFGMMLGFSRRLFSLHLNQMKKCWEHDSSGMGGLTEIHGKTIGIIGAGAIGSEVARLAKAFNMRVLGFRRTGAPSAGYDVMYGPGGLELLLSESDYIVNILPATKDTEKMIGDRQFDSMKKTAVYIAVGRGKTTDTDAIIRAMGQGKIAGAGLDVVDPEPLPQDSPLWDMDNVFIAGHNAGGTDRYMERAMDIFLPNLDDYLAGRKPGINLIDPELQY